VQGRETIQALQARIAAARAAAARGDREAALAEAAAALAIDPGCAAAQMLRDELRAGASFAPASPAAASATTAPSPSASDAAPDDESAAPAASAARFQHGVSAERYASFQERARRRRLERRVDAARDAIRRGRLNEAAAALDEVIELDPAAPELSALTKEFDVLRRRIATSHRGPWLAAAAAFAATIFAASYLEEASFLLSSPIAAAGFLMPAVTPSAASLIDVAAVGTTGERADLDLPQPLPGIEAPRAAAAAVVPASRPAAITAPRVAEVVLPLQPAMLPPPPQAAAAPVAEMRRPEPVAEMRRPDSVAEMRRPDPVVEMRRPEPAVERVSAPAPVDESVLVRNVLQRYRAAYQELDAQSAQAVWPAVNEAALARAFNGLESQSLTFDACDVRVNGAAASATCRGSARYVPKVGSREPRTEPRTWNFTLKKSGADWKIDTARAAR
jgi:hypothetical protein